jgi:FtsH-binding integral membrane protein
MTLILAAQTDYNRWLIALSFPAYRPSSLLGVILALVLALVGLAVDVVFSQPVGTVALWAATVATGLTLGLLAQEIRRILLCADLQ